MSYFSIELDKERNFRYSIKAIKEIEAKYKKPIAQIEQLRDTSRMSVDDYAFLICAGLKHEDKDLTPAKVIDLIDEYSTIGKVTSVMWEAFNAEFETEQAEQDVEEEGKNE